MLPKILCFLDTETTGIRASRDRIIEIGIIRVEEGKVIKKFESLINPGCLVPTEITNLTGITPADLENAPYFRQIKNEIKEILKGAVMVAHNARFDYSFLKNEFKRLEESFTQKHLCSVRLARKIFPEWTRHNLDSLISNLEIKCKKRHRALDDANVLYKFFKRVQKDFSKELVKEAVDFALRKPTLPLNLDPKFLEDLPESPGVYIFYGKSGIPLYVGKSINLRDRILSHFSSDHVNHKDMKISQQIESIETIKTAGELGALLKESYLVKKMQPLCNRKLRISRKMVLIRRIPTERGYLSVKIEDTDYINPRDIENILGVFRSRKQAKNFLIDLAKEKNLCEKLLGLEKGKGECFGYRLGWCLGACKGGEKTGKYNLRFIEAFSPTKIKPWPFKGRILIKEGSPQDREEGFLIDKWCYLGRITSGSQELESEYNFDLDTYKILLRHIFRSKPLTKILPIL
ncbi:MAG: exonuclease domain-containing protein [Patescibacteria group bacterium]|nr:exonuclease domain-containing protein [Patescibacteria group bacterium]